MGNLKDITGKKYGRLIALNIAFRKKSRTFWNCLCECGKIKAVDISQLNYGKTKSCGCYALETMAKARTKHGLYNKENRHEILVYRNMINRCYRKSQKGYEYYGGRGIKVCDSWLKSFANFFQDMGKRPSKEHSIERIDVNGNYEKANCKWATKKEQIKNRRPTKNKTGFSGVNFEKRGKKKYKACIRLNGKTKYLGRFDTAEEAHSAWKEAKNQRDLNEAKAQSR